MVKVDLSSILSSKKQKIKNLALIKSRSKKCLRLLLKSKTGSIGLVITLTAIFVAVFAPLLAMHDPAATDALNRLKPPMWMENGSASYPLGTDNLGRDILSRIIFGSRVSLIVGFSAVLLAGALGLILGLLAGYYQGAIDWIIMRVVDSFLSIPSILFMLMIISILGPSLISLIGVIGLTRWVTYARMVRSETLSVKEREYVKSARAVGARDSRIIFTYVLPNVISSFIVVATLSVATTIILEASLSFLGLGVQPPDVSWGLMLSDGRSYLSTSWWIVTFPGVAITLTVLGIIFVGDWLRDILDPRMKKR